MIKRITVWYKKIIAIGIHDEFSAIQNKHTRLVNIYILIALHTSILFYIGDLIFIQKPLSSHIISYISQFYLISVLICNKKGFFGFAKMLWILYLFIFINLSTVMVNPGIYTEYYFLLIPGISLSIYQKKTLPIIFTLVSIACFFIPYYYLDIYSKDHPNRMNGVVVIILFYCIYAIVNYFKKLNIRNEKKLELAYKELKESKKTELALLQLKSLRSQMNPHFIFNSLNSIQDLILQQNTDSSYDYVVLFSQLVRNTLNYSNKNFIAIDKELEFLEVYLQLEKLRFEDDFTYTIQHTNTEGLLVPSLIVQPFIENALIHGLLHKEGKKQLTIDFTFTDHLLCTITDNGIGRKEAKKIQERQGGRHESFALEAIKQRLEILKEQYGTAVGYHVQDLYDNKLATGTKVEIRMPYKKKY
ncbi:sensor histidine kinase YesM [Aquimarina sp. EL_43]|uniref:sensor histidine kinase n=1 Tax=unclassified Aquimarina TaxID=2627091 RepID=UPI0018CAC44A|nr:MULTISPECIES: histidine kinase [unclassified Aquimarina]MBG6129075.1 sensor histidine kinase YesM [Aquimarina sp. EL_35]MBG6150139.1 sensor histidine kinase YesM [Aquimarina sp. EL_32]MBG6167175.1 sensor histidine kinase YesM [Aquimarina sp. EL_43]